MITFVSYDATIVHLLKLQALSVVHLYYLLARKNTIALQPRDSETSGRIIAVLVSFPYLSLFSNFSQDCKFLYNLIIQILI